MQVANVACLSVLIFLAATINRVQRKRHFDQFLRPRHDCRRFSNRGLVVTTLIPVCTRSASFVRSINPCFVQQWASSSSLISRFPVAKSESIAGRSQEVSG